MFSRKNGLALRGDQIALAERSQGVLNQNFMRASDRAEIVHDVLSHLIENAAAGDTLEGIVEWWLLEQKIRRESAEVKEALDELVARQLIRAYKRRDNRVHYGINPRKKKEIRTLVERKDW